MDEKNLFTVYDLNARGEMRRSHEAPDGTPYALNASKGTLMPEAHALVFLKDPAFKVVHPDGRVLPPLPQSAMLREVDVQKLEPDETVAQYAELTTEALLARAVNRPGGHNFTGATSREALVSFLIRAPRVADAPLAQRPRNTGTPELDDAMPLSETNKLLEGANSALEGA